MARWAPRKEPVGRLERRPAKPSRCPEQTLLYQLVEQHYPTFVAALAAEGREVPGYVAREFEENLRCGRLDGVF